MLAGAVRGLGAPDESPGGPEFEGTSELETADVSGFLEWLTASAGADEGAGANDALEPVLNSARASGEVFWRGRDGSLALRDLRFAALGSAGAGHLSWDGGDADPGLSGALRFERLDLNQVRAFLRARRGAEGVPADASSGATFFGASGTALERASLALAADEIILGTDRLHGLEAHLRMTGPDALLLESVSLRRGFGFAAKGSGRVARKDDGVWSLDDGVFDLAVAEPQEAARFAGVPAAHSGLFEGARAALRLRGAFPQAGAAEDENEDGVLRGTLAANLGGGGRLEAQGRLALFSGPADEAEGRAFRLTAQGFLEAGEVRDFLGAAWGRSAPAFLSGAARSDFSLTTTMPLSGAGAVSARGSADLDAGRTFGGSAGEFVLSGARIGTFPFRAEVAWGAAMAPPGASTDAQELPRLEARLRGGRLDLTRGRAGAGADGASGVPPDLRERVRTGLRRLPRRSLPLWEPSEFSARLSMELDALLLAGNRRLHEPKAVFEVARGEAGFVLESFAASYESGGGASISRPRISADGVFRVAGDRWSGRADVGLEGLDLASLASGTPADGRLNGRLGLSGSFSSSGRSVHELVRGLAGDWDAEGLVVYRPQEAEIFASVLSGLLRDKLERLPTVRDWHEALNFALSRFGGEEARLSARGTFSDLAFHLDGGSVVGPRARLEAEGLAADLDDWRGEMRAEVYDAGAGAPLFFLALEGPLDGLRPSLRAGDGLAREPARAEGESEVPITDPGEFLEKGLEDLLRGILGGGG